MLLGYLLQTVTFGLKNFLHEIIYFGFHRGLVHSNAVIIYFRVSNQNLNLYKKCMKFFWKNFHKKVFLIFWVCVHSIKCIIPCFFIHPEYHIFLFKKSCFKYFPLLSFTDIEIKLDVNEIMELPVCVQKKIYFFCTCTKITFLHFWYIFHYLYSTTVLHFMCSVYADQFSSVLLNDKSTNIVLLHKSFILFASI